MVTKFALSPTQLVLNRLLACQLPSSLSFLYKALPIAEEGGWVTVMMAEPENEEAVEVIATVLGRPLYLVQADSVEIEHLLAELWPAGPGKWIHIFVFVPAGNITAHLQAHIQRIANSLNGKLIYQPSGREIPPTATLLLGKRQIWPLRHITLFWSDEAVEADLPNWLIYLAILGQAQITILVSSTRKQSDPLWQKVIRPLTHAGLDSVLCRADTPLSYQPLIDKADIVVVSVPAGAIRNQITQEQEWSFILALKPQDER